MQCKLLIIFEQIKQMGRIMAIDYGSKRVGIAVTDNLKMIASGLTTVHSKDVIEFLKKYLATESVECIVVGEPKQMNNEASESERLIIPFIKSLAKAFPGMKIERMDERFTSKMAFQTLIDSGIKKKDRKDKAVLDEVSATIILQSYLEKLSWNNG
jgi:putative Holliday junction resolvase